MKTIVAIIGVLIVSPTLAQEHAPLPDQCKADFHLWHSQNKSSNDNLSFDELQKRSREMWACGEVDRTPGNENYLLLWSAYQVVSAQRMEHFLKRHNLGKQFLEEDAAGAR